MGISHPRQAAQIIQTGTSRGRRRRWGWTPFSPDPSLTFLCEEGRAGQRPEGRAAEKRAGHSLFRAVASIQAMPSLPYGCGQGG